jgi:predicted nucleic acid-binding protein/plasmid stability protein
MMPTTLTLKNIPDEVYERLKASAETHRRSLNSEAIVCLESVLLPGRISVTERLARARALRRRHEFHEAGRPAMIVVDTNVIAYLYLDTAFTRRAEELLETDPEWAAPPLWRSEFRNILAGALRRGALKYDQALEILAEAEDLLSGYEQEVPTRQVMELVRDSDCTAYDCEFVALARQLGVKLVTHDSKLLKSFPKLAVPLPSR